MEKERNLELVFNCPFCGKTHSLYVNFEDFIDYQNGKLAQNAFPYCTATEREQIISHICPTCQDNIFGSEDDEEDYELEETPLCPHFQADCPYCSEDGVCMMYPMEGDLPYDECEEFDGFYDD